MKTAFLYSDKLANVEYEPTHPLKPFRLELTFELIKAYGLLSLAGARLVEPRFARDDELTMFHGKEYLDVLKEANNGRPPAGAGRFGLGPGDNPVFKGMYDWSALLTGASLQAAELVDSGEVDTAFNIAGGLHHAMRWQASGFCYINDPVIAITSLLRKGRKVAYIDIDAHHGDGVEDAFYDTDQVLTISIHETGMMLFPGTGFVDDAGTRAGEGYSVNIPMPPFSDDELFVYAFNETVPGLIEAFRPDIIVSQLGVDSLRSDPLAHLSYTTNGFCEVVRKIKEISPGWVALGGGGYDISNVARAWTLAWSIMNGVDIPDSIPEDFLRKYSGYGFGSGKIRDEVYTETHHQKERMRDAVQKTIRHINEKILPKVRRH